MLYCITLATGGILRDASAYTSVSLAALFEYKKGAEEGVYFLGAVEKTVLSLGEKNGTKHLLLKILKL